MVYPVSNSNTVFFNPVKAFLKQFLFFPTFVGHSQGWHYMATFPFLGDATAKRVGAFAVLLIVGGSLLVLAKGHAHEARPIVFDPLQGVEWVKKSLRLHPEIEWLADSKVRKTEEGHASLQGTYSEQIYGQKYVEFDRTLMTLHCLKLILKGNAAAYAKFTEAQPPETKLAPAAFQELHQQGKALLESHWRGLSRAQMAMAMETALVLGDMGKSALARQIFSGHGIKAPDHDDFYGEAIHILEKNPDLSKSFKNLPKEARRLLVIVANLAHYGHITHLEGSAAMFSELKASQIAANDPVAQCFSLFVHTIDVAGALGHVNNQSSLVYNQQAHRAMQAMNRAVCTLADPAKGELDAYNAYLGVRAGWLGLDPLKPADRVLTRIGAMLRLYTSEEGLILQKAMGEIDEEMQRRIAKQLDIELESPLRTPTYMPALLVNLADNGTLAKTRAERLHQAVLIGLPFITRVLEEHSKQVANGQFDPQVPLNFNPSAGTAKKTPRDLEGRFTIASDGQVIVNP